MRNRASFLRERTRRRRPSDLALVRRIVASIQAREAAGLAWALTDYTTSPTLQAQIQARLEHTLGASL